jgi:hypothetical protein
MTRTLFAAVLAATCLLTNLPNTAHGAAPLRLENPRSQRWQIGMRITATGACSGIVATLPVPLDWPEQQVKIVDQELSCQVRPLSYRTLPPGGARQMIVAIPRLAAGETATAVVTFEVTKHDILGAESTAAWSIPARVDATLRPYLGTSPSIETNHPEITRLAAEIGQEAATDWENVKAIYDWVRANIRYEFDVELRGALTSLRAGHGDCEELTSLFIALCRVNGIPARSVWVPGHCYPEFYLQAADGQGCWFPCQAAGAEAFGTMQEARPILQKGDNFRVPGEAVPKRYVAQTCRAKNAVGDPRVEWICRPLTETLDN